MTIRDFDGIRKSNAVDRAEANGMVADSGEVRLSLLRRFKSGEISFGQMQAELKAIKRSAKKNGKTTRERAFLDG